MSTDRSEPHEERSAGVEPEERNADPEKTGVEPEDTSAKISQPFDPNKIHVRLWTPTIDRLMRLIKDGEIDLAPEFQRKESIWNEGDQSRLVESILIRLPLPAFFIDGIDEDRFAVIDGIQRLTTLKRFINDGTLRLTGLDFLKDLEGKTFSELPRTLQRRIEETMATVNIIDKGTPDDAKLHLFKRINTRGRPLTAQEIRHAINPGPARGFLKDLAESEDFRTATVGSINPDRMHDRECALRFVAFVLMPPDRYQAQFDSFLNQAMRALNSMTPDEREALARRFQRAMRAATAILGNKAFRKLTPDRRGPINKALFEAWSVNLDACSDEQLETLYERRDELVKAFMHLLKSRPDFELALSQGTGDRSKVLLRFEEIGKLIQRVIS